MVNLTIILAKVSKVKSFYKKLHPIAVFSLKELMESYNPN